jgi:hypothetical protein
VNKLDWNNGVLSVKVCSAMAAAYFSGK